MENRNTVTKLTFETIKKFDKSGIPYWTAREFCKALGYSSYQKFSDLVSRCMEIAQNNGLIHIDDHFIRTDEMVKIGSGANRTIENYYLYKEACLIIAKNADKKKIQVSAAIEYFSRTDIDFNGAECDLNIVDSLPSIERASIRLKNQHYWKKLNEESSRFYQDRMSILKSESGLTLDNTFLGNKAPHHIMYKLGEPLKSEDGCRGYEFLIEYDIEEPTVGIYYGCKGLIYTEDIDSQISRFNKEWNAIKNEVATILNNTFPGKQFNMRFKATNNANNNTYWPFWVTLYEEEDIVEVAVRAINIIKRVYSKYIRKGIYDFDFKINQMDKSDNNTSKKHIMLRYPTALSFTEEAYNELAETKRNYGDILKELDYFISIASSKKINIITKNEDYEKAWNATEDTTLFAYTIQTFFTRLIKDGIYKKNGTPWVAISKVFLDKDGKVFGDGVLKNCINGCKNRSGQKAHNEYTRKAEDIIFRIYVK